MILVGFMPDSRVLFMILVGFLHVKRLLRQHRVNLLAGQSLTVVSTLGLTFMCKPTSSHVIDSKDNRGTLGWMWLEASNNHALQPCSFPIHVNCDEDTRSCLITTCPLSNQHVIDSVGPILSALVAMTVRRATVLTLVGALSPTFYVYTLVPRCERPKC